MGGGHSAITEQQFSKLWHRTHQFDNVNIWENRINPSQQIEEHLVPEYSDEKSNEIFELRQDNPYVVNAFSLKRDDGECCSGNSTRRIILERIPVRLSNVNDIPYPDILHVYDSSLKGYYALTRNAGYFHVDQDMIGINQHGNVKVWLNTAFELGHPTRNNDFVTEDIMVEQILNIIAENTDAATLPRNAPNLNQFLRANNNLTLGGVESSLIDYVKQYNDGYMPTNLTSVKAVGGIDQIVHWCRKNQGHGYNGTNEQSLRLSESVRLNQIRNSNNLYRNTVYSIKNNTPNYQGNSQGNYQSNNYQSNNFQNPQDNINWNVDSRPSPTQFRREEPVGFRNSQTNPVFGSPSQVVVPQPVIRHEPRISQAPQPVFTPRNSSANFNQISTFQENNNPRIASHNLGRSDVVAVRQFSSTQTFGPSQSGQFGQTAINRPTEIVQPRVIEQPRIIEQPRFVEQPRIQQANIQPQPFVQQSQPIAQQPRIQVQQPINQVQQNARQGAPNQVAILQVPQVSFVSQQVPQNVQPFQQIQQVQRTQQFQGVAQQNQLVQVQQQAQQVHIQQPRQVQVQPAQQQVQIVQQQVQPIPQQLQQSQPIPQPVQIQQQQLQSTQQVQKQQVIQQQQQSIQQTQVVSQQSTQVKQQVAQQQVQQQQVVQQQHHSAHSHQHHEHRGHHVHHQTHQHKHAVHTHHQQQQGAQQVTQQVNQNQQASNNQQQVFSQQQQQVFSQQQQSISQQQSTSLQNQSRLQAQRVINQKIQIKQDQVSSNTLIDNYREQADKVPETLFQNTGNNYTHSEQGSYRDQSLNALHSQPSGKSSQMMEWQDYTKILAGQNLQSKQAKSIGGSSLGQQNLSFGANSQEYQSASRSAATSDGKTSDQFFKMINELKASSKITASNATSSGYGSGQYNYASKGNQQANQYNYGKYSYSSEDTAGATNYQQKFSYGIGQALSGLATQGEKYSYGSYDSSNQYNYDGNNYAQGYGRQAYSHGVSSQEYSAATTTNAARGGSSYANEEVSGTAYTSSNKNEHDSYGTDYQSYYMRYANSHYNPDESPSNLLTQGGLESLAQNGQRLQNIDIQDGTHEFREYHNEGEGSSQRNYFQSEDQEIDPELLADMQAGQHNY